MNKTTEVFESKNSNYSSTSVERALKLAERAVHMAYCGLPPTSIPYAAALAAIREALAEPTKNQFNPDWDVAAELVEENKRLAMENEKLRHGEIKYEDWLYNPMTGKPIWGDAEPVKQEPSVSDGVCCGCAKTAADGWALYCVECWEKANGDPFANAGKMITEPVKQEPLCEDEGCPHHGTTHICFSDPSVLDKPFACETGECPDKPLCVGSCECLYKAEPVAWLVTSEGLGGTPKTYPITGRYKDVRDVCDFGDPIPLYASPVQLIQNPVAWWNGKETVWFEHELCGWQAPDDCTIPLYAAPVDAKAIREQTYPRIHATRNERAKALEDAADAVRFADNGTEAAEIIRGMK